MEQIWHCVVKLKRTFLILLDVIFCFLPIGIVHLCFMQLGFFVLTKTVVWFLLVLLLCFHPCFQKRSALNIFIMCNYSSGELVNRCKGQKEPSSPSKTKMGGNLLGEEPDKRCWNSGLVPVAWPGDVPRVLADSVEATGRCLQWNSVHPL